MTPESTSKVTLSYNCNSLCLALPCLAYYGIIWYATSSEAHARFFSKFVSKNTKIQSNCEQHYARKIFLVAKKRSRYTEYHNFLCIPPHTTNHPYRTYCVNHKIHQSVQYYRRNGHC
jgi:hypothetical protein